MTRPWKMFFAHAPALLAMLTVVSLSSCASSTRIKGLPSKLPDIPLSGTVRTPPHSMQSFQYPFDSNGRYVSEWAAEGEKKAGRSAAATSSDQQQWSGSHGGSATGKRTTATVRKTTGSKSSGSSGGGSKYVVKAGDTLSAIARRNGTTVAKLKSANGLSSDFLSIGKVLRIPR